MRGLLQAFQPLSLSWSGSGELKTLLKAEWRGGLPLLGGSALLCGFYLNELLLKLLPREDPHPRLFATTSGARRASPRGAEQAPVLRRFELELLAELGYALPLDARCRHRRRRSIRPHVPLRFRSRARARVGADAGTAG